MGKQRLLVVFIAEVGMAMGSAQRKMRLFTTTIAVFAFKNPLNLMCFLLDT
jgi:hypothetical protein